MFIKWFLGEQFLAEKRAELARQESEKWSIIDRKIDAALRRFHPGQDPADIRRRYPEKIRSIRQQMVEVFSERIALGRRFIDSL
jgi:hypothetical protein